MFFSSELHDFIQIHNVCSQQLSTGYAPDFQKLPVVEALLQDMYEVNFSLADS